MTKNICLLQLIRGIRERESFSRKVLFDYYKISQWLKKAFQWWYVLSSRPAIFAFYSEYFEVKCTTKFWQNSFRTTFSSRNNEIQRFSYLISNGCNPDEDGKRWVASNIFPIISSETACQFIFNVVYRQFNAFIDFMFLRFFSILKCIR